MHLLLNVILQLSSKTTHFWTKFMSRLRLNVKNSLQVCPSILYTFFILLYFHVILLA